MQKSVMTPWPEHNDGYEGRMNFLFRLTSLPQLCARLGNELVKSQMQSKKLHAQS